MRLPAHRPSKPIPATPPDALHPVNGRTLAPGLERSGGGAVAEALRGEPRFGRAPAGDGPDGPIGGAGALGRPSRALPPLWRGTADAPPPQPASTRRSAAADRGARGWRRPSRVEAFRQAPDVASGDRSGERIAQVLTWREETQVSGLNR